MKRLLFAIFILLIIIAFGVCEQIFISRFYDKTLSLSEQVKTNLAEGCENAIESANSLKKYWLNYRSALEAITPHNETKEMVIRISELIGYLEANDDKSSRATIEIIIEMCRNTPHILGFHWEHIF